jgi:predicted ester cyclase
VGDVETTARMRAMVNAHLEALCGAGDGRAGLADDTTLTIMETGEVTRGGAAVAALLTYLHHTAFAAPPVVSTLVVGTNRALIEAEFTGRHTGEFAGIAPTGRMVRLHYVAAYDLGADAIGAVRLYFPMDALIRQLRDR